MRISDSDNIILAPDSKDVARETMAVVRRVVENSGTDTDTFCKWLAAQKVDVNGPLSGICHWFTHPERALTRGGHVSRYHVRQEVPRDNDHVLRSDVVSQFHHSTSISIIMILAAVLFILIITALVTCIIRKKRRPHQRPVDHLHSSMTPAMAVSTIVLRKDRPPDYNSVIQMKEREEAELPSYSQAVLVNESFVGDDGEMVQESDIKPSGDDKPGSSAAGDNL